MCLLRFIVSKWKSKLLFHRATRTGDKCEYPEIDDKFHRYVFRRLCYYSEYIGKSVEAINSLFHPTKSYFDEILILIFSLEFLGMGLNGQCIVATLVGTFFKVNIELLWYFFFQVNYRECGFVTDEVNATISREMKIGFHKAL